MIRESLRHSVSISREEKRGRVTILLSNWTYSNWPLPYSTVPVYHCLGMPCRQAGSTVSVFAESQKQDSKRFNSQGRRNTFSIWLYNFSMPLGKLGTYQLILLELICWSCWLLSADLAGPSRLILLELISWSCWHLSVDLAGTYQLILLALICWSCWHLSADLAGTYQLILLALICWSCWN